MPSRELPELKRRLALHADSRLAARQAEQVLHIHAELPLNRITPVLAGECEFAMPHFFEEMADDDLNRIDIETARTGA